MSAHGEAQEIHASLQRLVEGHFRGNPRPSPRLLRRAERVSLDVEDLQRRILVLMREWRGGRR